MENNPSSNPKVSVIMPVYNAGNYLRQSLDCLLKQSCPDFEVLCVDDGSGDDSLKILREYADRDSRFTVYTQEHRYAGAARNLGIRHARGAYLLFLDADDVYSPEIIALPLRRCEETGAEICVFPLQRYHEGSGKMELQAHSCLADCYSTPVFSYKDNPDNIFRFTTSGPCNKMFKAELIRRNGLAFQTIRHAEDVSFVMTALALAEKITTLSVPLYTYRQVSSSLQHTTDEHPLCFYEAQSELRKRLIRFKRYEVLEQAFINEAAANFVYELESFQSTEAFEKAYRLIRETALEEFRLTGHPDDYFNAYPHYRLAERIRVIQNGSMLEYLTRYPFALPEFRKAVLRNLSGRELLTELLRRARARI